MRNKSIFILFVVFLLISSTLLAACGDDTVSDISEEISELINESKEESGDEVVKTDNLAYHCFYAYDYGFNIKGDDHLTALTDGDVESFVELNTDINKDSKDYIELNYGDWYGKTHTVKMDKNYISFSVDLGFISSVNKVSLVLKDYSGSYIEIFASTDGYNFTDYIGKFNLESNDLFEADVDFDAKAILFVLPATVTDVIKISEIIVKGERAFNKELLSLGASYNWKGSPKSSYKDENSEKLTDGKFFYDLGKEAVVGKSSTEVDPLVNKSGSIIDIDLGEVKNVSEVSFGVYIPKSGVSAIPERIDIRYSTDGENWLDLGQSYLMSSSGTKDNASYKYLVTRNHTVEARYVKVLTYVTGTLLIDEISVSGCNEKVEEPDYDFIKKKNQLSNSNISAYKNIKLNDADVKALSDMSFVNFADGLSGENNILVELGESYNDICAVAINYKGSTISEISLNIGNSEIGFEEYDSTVAGSSVKYLFFKDNSKGNSVSISLKSSSAIKISEVMVFAGQPQLPLVKGGFFQLPTGGAGNQSSQNSEYSWYLQLKGMRDLGMEYVVIQYSAHYNAKSTLINGKNIKAKGFKYNATYGCEDVCLAVLNAAEKLGMKVYLGTIHDSDFTNPISNMESYSYIVDAGFAIIKDIAEMYGDHPAFEGYYLSDETCDQWLNLKGGVDAARYVYKNQSDYIREIDSDAKIMIAPAIWRSGKPTMGADNLYKMLVPEKEGDKPVVDIVAAQDCLGREGTLFVTDGAYSSFEQYVEEWAKAVRRAGAEFWHDAEVFEIISSSKRYDEVVKSLNIEMKTSGSVIVFDIPHYFSSFSMGAYNDVRNFYKVKIMRDYAKYYSTIEKYDKIGTDADQPNVITDDGKVVDTSGNLPVIKPIITSKKYNEGVLVNDTPNASKVEKWHNFKLGNNSGNVPQYALYWDNDNFYVLLKTNDATSNFGQGVWWEGKDDLVQIWMTTDGSTANAALDHDSGIRYYLHRQDNSSWVSGGSAGALATYSGFTFESVDDVIIIKMPWKSLNLEVPTKDANTAIGVKIQYIDGQDQSWASSDATKDQSIKVSALYSF